MFLRDYSRESHVSLVVVYGARSMPAFAPGGTQFHDKFEL